MLEAIVRSVCRAGGAPVLVPAALGVEALSDVVSRLDGLLLSGGGDLDPVHYGATMHPTVAGVDSERDHQELELARWAVAQAKPMFGICRGLQVLNVALGGTLYRDIMGEHVKAQRHPYSPGLPFDLRPHLVVCTAGSLLEQVLGGTEFKVNSLHHQASRDIAPGLRVAARAPDGIVEALEAPTHPFCLAVQWHPECLPDAPEMRRLFESFIAAASGAVVRAPVSATPLQRWVAPSGT